MVANLWDYNAIFMRFITVAAIYEMCQPVYFYTFVIIGLILRLG